MTSTKPAPREREIERLSAYLHTDWTVDPRLRREAELRLRLQQRDEEA